MVGARCCGEAQRAKNRTRKGKVCPAWVGVHGRAGELWEGRKNTKETIARTARCGGGSVSSAAELPEKSELVYAVGENGVGLRDSDTHFMSPGPTPELPRKPVGNGKFQVSPWIY